MDILELFGIAFIICITFSACYVIIALVEKTKKDSRDLFGKG